VAAALLAGLGCDDSPAGDGSGTLVRDSAGVEIVENRGYAWTEGEGWRVADTASVEIGVAEGDPSLQLFSVVGATRLRDGRIAVANSGTAEIRFYDSAGAFIDAVGRSGEGPGEFREIESLWPFRGDSLAVWDDRLRRLTVLTPEGTVGRVTAVVSAPLNPKLLGPLDDGSLLLNDETLDPPTARLRQRPLHVTRFGSDGGFADSMGAFPGLKMMLLATDESTVIGVPRFTSLTRFAAAGSRLFAGDGTAPEVVAVGPGGAILRRIRWPDSDRAVTQEHIDRYREEVMSWQRDEVSRRHQRAYLDAVPYEPTFPAYQRIVASRNGGLWLQRYRRPGEAGPNRWIVIDSAGRALGEVAVPEALYVWEVGSEYLLAVHRDDLGVERVRMVAIIKP
jgi:hypothetical protein